MNELICSMAKDMSIPVCESEDTTEYIKRVIYSALGQWCLKSASTIKYGGNTTTKHRQTNLINNLLETYKDLFPEINDYFESDKEVAIFIRNVYEATGYFVTNADNHNRIATFGRTVKAGNKHLFFGEPFENETNGLGIFSNQEINAVDINDFLIRDSLSCEEYIQSCFDIVDFDEWHEDIDGLQFFNPSLDKPVSASWKEISEGEYVIARSENYNHFYLMQRFENKTYYKDFLVNEDTTEFTSYEYRRLYFALKKQCGHPVKVWVNRIDDNYSKIRLSCHLPNREYYLLLLLSWPIDNVFNKSEFLIKNDFLEFILEVFENIGIEGEHNG